MVRESEENTDRGSFLKTGCFKAQKIVKSVIASPIGVCIRKEGGTSC